MLIEFYIHVAQFDSAGGGRAHAADDEEFDEHEVGSGATPEPNDGGY